MSLEPQRRTKTLFLNKKVVKDENEQEESKPAVKHHTLFKYPLKPEPNPAFASFFDKLEEVKKELEGS